MLANSIENGLSVKLIYNIFFIKNTHFRPFVRITISVSNFLARFRTVVFFKEEKNHRIAFIKKTVHYTPAPTAPTEISNMDCTIKTANVKIRPNKRV